MIETFDEQAFRDHLRATGARETCPLCDAGRWSLRVVCGGEFLGRVCSACGHVLLFDTNDVAQTAHKGPRMKRTAAALRERIEQGMIELEIRGTVQLDSQTITHAIWPNIEILLDESLAISLAQIGVPGSGKSGVGGEP